MTLGQLMETLPIFLKKLIWGAIYGSFASLGV
jgi:hypothetical protein